MSIPPFVPPNVPAAAPAHGKRARKISKRTAGAANYVSRAERLKNILIDRLAGQLIARSGACQRLLEA